MYRNGKGASVSASKAARLRSKSRLGWTHRFAGSTLGAAPGNVKPAYRHRCPLVAGMHRVRAAELLLALAPNSRSIVVRTCVAHDGVRAVGHRSCARYGARAVDEDAVDLASPAPPARSMVGSRLAAIWLAPPMGYAAPRNSARQSPRAHKTALAGRQAVVAPLCRQHGSKLSTRARSSSTRPASRVSETAHAVRAEDATEERGQRFLDEVERQAPQTLPDGGEASIDRVSLARKRRTAPHATGRPLT